MGIITPNVTVSEDAVLIGDAFIANCSVSRCGVPDIRLEKARLVSTSS